MAFELTEWVDCVFGQAEPSNYNPERLEEICGPDEATLLRLIEVFENPTAFLKPYPDAVIDRAFWDLDGGGGGVFEVIYGTSVDWEVRLRFIRSFEIVFRELFAVRWAPALGHCDEEGSGLTACYMWFDFNCWLPMRDPMVSKPFDAAFLASMQAVLAIDHVACQESALHGLGHWHHKQSAAVETIIDEFVKNQRHLPERLTEYASAARRGSVQ